MDAAVSRALREESGSARVVRAAKIPVALPPSWREEEAGGSARVAVVDAQSLGAIGPMVADAPPGVTVVVVAPIAQDGTRGLFAKLSAGMRRLAPVELVDACEALRHSGVVGVRVAFVDGALGLAVLAGRAT